MLITNVNIHDRNINSTGRQTFPNGGNSLTKPAADKKKTKTDIVEIKNKPKEKYNDPLLNWPLRGLAFTNDIGAVIMDIAPTLGTILWIPSLMYFGADVYDKYKSDERKYNPDAKRGFKQAIFQSLASIVMPIVLVHNGQKAASIIGQAFKPGLSLQMKQEVEKFTVNHLKRRRLKDYENNIDKFKSEFNEHLKHHLLDQEKSFKTKNPFKILMRWIFSPKHGEKITDEKLKKIENYTNKNIDEMFAIRKDLLDGKKPQSISNKMMKFYENTKRSFSKDQNTIEGYVEDSIKALLKQRQRDRLFKTKFHASIGGLVLLGISVPFVDKFIEKQIMENLIEPYIDNMDFGDTRKKAKEKILEKH